MKILIAFTFLFSGLCLFGQSYEAAESVEYDESQNRWIIANGSNLLQKSLDGTLSIFSNVSGSHGTEIMGDYVFTLDVGNTVRGIRLDTEEAVMDLYISEAGFLNGLTNDGNGILYATDFSQKKIYKIDVTDVASPSYELFVAETEARPNGIFYDGPNNRVIWIDWGGSAKVQAIDLDTEEITILLETTLSNLDGIEQDTSGHFYISSWGPSQITKYDANFENEEILATPPIPNPADIGYNHKRHQLAIPIGGDVVYFDLGDPTFSSDLPSLDLDMKIVPNPIISEASVLFDNPSEQLISILIYDQMGKHIQTIRKGYLPMGQQKVTFDMNAFKSGIYTCVVKGFDFVDTQLFVKQ